MRRQHRLPGRLKPGVREQPLRRPGHSDRRRSNLLLSGYLQRRLQQRQSVNDGEHGNVERQSLLLGHRARLGELGFDEVELDLVHHQR